MEKHIAIIGSGPTAIYILKHLQEDVSFFKTFVKSITIFEKSTIGGMGMPYHPEMTDIYNLSNISSEEIPMLNESLVSWLNNQPKEILKTYNIQEFPINASKVYSRIALGHYFKDQFDVLLENLRAEGVVVEEVYGVSISDVIPQKGNVVHLLSSNGKVYNNFTNVIIATGHIWSEKDQPEIGYYGSPWPIHKLLPDKNTYHNYPIGTLGASLSAFDVLTSLAHRHGTFYNTGEGLQFKIHPDARGFKIVMHSAEGWLPHLQYEQEKPIREIYRHTDNTEMMSLIDTAGFLPLNNYFDKICRPALITAFEKDGNRPLIALLSESHIGILEFVEHMAAAHDYVNSFEGMRKELEQARRDIEHHKPTHWMETLDDLMYCLNFHSELLSAEDHLFLKQKMMPFLMNVIAALPLPSARILLALYDAGYIELIKGKVKILKTSSQIGKTTIQVAGETGEETEIDYTLFINCAGQGNIEFASYPFPTLIENNHVRKASARFRNPTEISNNDTTFNIKNIDTDSDYEAYLFTGGIAVDSGYSIMNSMGTSDPRLYDVSFVHTAGCRPYSYGLQACNATSVILVEQLKRNFSQQKPNHHNSITDITQIYEGNAEL